MSDVNDELSGDPIVRCDGCNKLVHRAYIAHHAGCNHCGNKRFKNVTGLSGEELRGLEHRKYDLGMEYELAPEYLGDWKAA